MVVGTVGAILFSLYIKKTYNYKLALKITSFGSFIVLLISSVIGYGTTKASLLTIIVLSIFILFSAILFFFVKIDLKRQ